MSSQFKSVKINLGNNTNEGVQLVKRCQQNSRVILVDEITQLQNKTMVFTI
jgi:nucleoside-triphosphatase THEP1